MWRTLWEKIANKNRRHCYCHVGDFSTEEHTRKDITISENYGFTRPYFSTLYVALGKCDHVKHKLSKIIFF